MQGNKWQRRAVKRILLQALDRVFRPLDENDTRFRQEPASVKKLRKGDACWTTSKIILGWLIDTVDKTIRLPEHRGDRLLEILNSIPTTQRSIATKEWHKIIGELRSMSVAMRGCTGLFSILQEAFCHKDKSRNHLCLSPTCESQSRLQNCNLNCCYSPTGHSIKLVLMGNAKFIVCCLTNFRFKRSSKFVNRQTI